MNLSVYLQQIELFGGADKKILKKIEPLFLVRKYKKGEVILKPEEKGRIFLVKKGRVELYQISDDGKKFVTEIIGQGNVFGDVGLNIRTERFVETLDDCIIYSINREKFLLLLEKVPQLASRIFLQFGSRLIAAHKKTSSLATDDVLRRLVKLLLTLGKSSDQDKPNQNITDKFTHEHLAQMLGVSRQIVTVSINYLERKGLIRRVKKKFVFNKTKLEKFVS